MGEELARISHRFLLNGFKSLGFDGAVHASSVRTEGIRKEYVLYAESTYGVDWEYVWSQFDSDELYNLREDPMEMKNLTGDPSFGEFELSWR